jgi:deoxyxylulose-5-phosphate synthase
MEDKLKTTRITLDKLRSKLGIILPIEEISKHLNQNSFSPQEIKNNLNRLIKSGEIIRIKENFIQVEDNLDVQTEEQIKTKILDSLRDLWFENESQRFGQLLMNYVFPIDGNMWEQADRETLRKIKKAVKKETKRNQYVTYKHYDFTRKDIEWALKELNEMKEELENKLKDGP